MDIEDLVKEFVASLHVPGHSYVMGAKAFAAFVKEQRYNDRFCSCLEDYDLYIDHSDRSITKCSGCDKPVWAV